VLRPDLPKPLVALVDRALSLSPARRPAAGELARALRGAAEPRKRKSRDLVATSSRPGRIGAAGLAGVYAGWTTSALPFFPHGWPLGLGLAVAALSLVRDRLGLAAALAAPVLPLGNVSLGLALLYGALAAGWLALSWREPRGGLLFALGPALAPLGLVPLAASRLRAGPRRAVTALLAVLTAALVAGIRHAGLPFTGTHAPLGLGVAGARDPLDVAGSLARAAAAHPPLLIEAAAFAVLAVALPRVRGRWGAAGLGAGMLVACVLAVPSAAPLPLVAAAWVTALAVALR